MSNILVSSWFYPHLTTENGLAEANWGNKSVTVINTFSRSAINVRGSTILLAGGSQSESGVDIILQ